MNKLAWMIAILGLLGAAAVVVWTAAGAATDRRVGRLAIACFIGGLALALESLFLGQQMATAELNAGRAGSCAEAAEADFSNFGCRELLDGSDEMTDASFLRVQEEETQSAARRDRSSGLFGDAAKLLIGLALADLFAKRLLEIWKSSGPDPA